MDTDGRLSALVRFETPLLIGLVIRKLTWWQPESLKVHGSFHDPDPGQKKKNEREREREKERKKRGKRVPEARVRDGRSKAQKTRRRSKLKCRLSMAGYVMDALAYSNVPL